MTSDTEKRRSVAVIGAGASGLTAAKRLKAEGLKVIVFERQPERGGVWNYTADASDMFASPVYGSLEANFPKELMEFSDMPWDGSVSLYPKHDAIGAYLRKYSIGVHVTCSTEVVKLFPLSQEHTHNWRLTTRHTKSGKEKTGDFDYVVMATGAFDRPFVPNYDGLREWGRKYPNSISHSNTYRDANDFKGKRVVVAGNSASGWDISAQLAHTAKKLWVASTRSKVRSHKKAIPVNKVVRLVPNKQQVRFDGDKKARRVDKIIFCTGYLYSSNFLKEGKRSEKPLFPDGFCVNDLYQHIFWKLPTLAFVGIPKSCPTFPVSQAQSAVVARAFSRRIDHLPTSEDMATWVEGMVKRSKKRKRDETDRNKIHNLGYPGFRNYIDDLELWCLEEDEMAGEDAPEGNEAFQWTDRMDWVLRNRREIRKAFRKRETSGETFSTPESLGFFPHTPT